MRYLFLFILLSLGSVAHASAWRVELDGSGHFTSIQEAVDAAAIGDTVQIGPGRFYENPMGHLAATQQTVRAERRPLSDLKARFRQDSW